MATPQSPADDGEAPQNNFEQITFRFCSECSNMLYPKEDEDSHKLQFTCRTCQYTEEATSSCVFRNVMNNAAGETAGVTQDVGSDPTVGSHVSSPSLAHASAPTTGRASCSADDSLALCLRCGHTLLHCDRCEDPASVDEFNHYVRTDPDFAVSRSLCYINMATHWNSLDSEGRNAWDARFASGVPAPTAPSSQDSLTQYLPFDIALDPDADPPEALEMDQEDYTMGETPFMV
ncbi:hypothetical protein GGR56DRAFT_288085 [Xylariaceae sp. FL0804]|nr:hypothetical protein GGR56DRAFT_288085 [Xylariaceae sp. FL0804]